MRNLILACAIGLAGCASAPADPAPAPQPSNELRRLSALELVSALSGNVVCSVPGDDNSCEGISTPQSVTASEVRMREVGAFDLASLLNNDDGFVDFITSQPSAQANSELFAELGAQRAAQNYAYVKIVEPAHLIYDAARGMWCHPPRTADGLDGLEFWFSNTLSGATNSDQRFTPDTERRFRAFLRALLNDPQMREITAADQELQAATAALLGAQRLCYAYLGSVRDGRPVLRGLTMFTYEGAGMEFLNEDARAYPSNAALTLRPE